MFKKNEYSKSEFFNIIYKNIIKIWEKGAFHIFIGSFLLKFVSFFGSIFLIRLLSKSEYGLLSYMENLYGYFFIFAGYGLANALLRYMILAQSKKEKYSYFKYTTRKSFFFNIVIVIIVFIFSYIYKHPIEFKDAKSFLPLIILALPFHYLHTSSLLAYRAMMENKKYALYTFVSSFILIISRYISAKFFGIKGVIYAMILVYLFFGILITYIFIKKYFKNIESEQIKLLEKKEINNYSFQYMITNGIWALFMLNDIFLLGRITGDPNIVANYRVAYTLPANIAIFSTAIGIFIGPYFVKHENDKTWVWKNYKKTMIVNIALLLPIVLTIILFSNPLINLLFGEQYIVIAPVMRLLTVAAFANSGLRYVSAHLLSSMGEIKYNMRISAIAVLIQFILNIVFIPAYGVYGAAYTSILVYMGMSVALFVVFKKIYR